jgi:hypothetical protein
VYGNIIGLHCFGSVPGFRNSQISDHLPVISNINLRSGMMMMMMMMMIGKR